MHHANAPVFSAVGDFLTFDLLANSPVSGLLEILGPFFSPASVAVAMMIIGAAFGLTYRNLYHRRQTA